MLSKSLQCATVCCFKTGQACACLAYWEARRTQSYLWQVLQRGGQCHKLALTGAGSRKTSVQGLAAAAMGGWQQGADTQKLHTEDLDDLAMLGLPTCGDLVFSGGSSRPVTWL